MNSTRETDAGLIAHLRAYGRYLFLRWKQLTARGENRADEFTRLGYEAYGQGFVDLADRALRRGVKGSPHDVDAQVTLGNVRYWRGELAEAQQSFESALELDPANSAALLGAAASLHARGSPSEAIYFYLSYLDEMPDDVSAMLSLAAAFQDTRQYEAAIEMFDRALELKPDDVDVHGQYGRALYELGRQDDAATHLRRATQLGSRDTEVYRALGLILEGEKRVDEARDEYERAIQVDPVNASARLLLSGMLTNAGPPIPGEDAEVALQQVTEAIRIIRSEGGTGAELGTAFWQLGWVHYVREEWSESAAASREALEHDSSLAPVRFNLGLALLRAGEPEQALAAYRAAAEVVEDAFELRADGIKISRPWRKSNPIYRVAGRPSSSSTPGTHNCAIPRARCRLHRSAGANPAPRTER